MSLKTLELILIGVLVCAGSFWAGIRYQAAQAPVATNDARFMPVVGVVQNYSAPYLTIAGPGGAETRVYVTEDGVGATAITLAPANRSVGSLVAGTEVVVLGTVGAGGAVYARSIQINPSAQ